MTELILSEEQKALAEKRHRLSPKGQVERFSRAISRALDACNEEIGDEGGRPAIQAALSSLAGAQAWLISQAGERGERRQLVRYCEQELSGALRHTPKDNSNCN